MVCIIKILYLKQMIYYVRLVIMIVYISNIIKCMCIRYYYYLGNVKQPSIVHINKYKIQF